MHMHGLAVYVEEGLPFAWDVSLENSADVYLCFQLALLHSLSYFFSSINHLLHLCAWFLFFFTYSSGTDRPGKLCSNFSISDDLAQTVNFPTWIPDCHSHSPVLLDFLLLMLLFVLQGFPYTGKF